MEESILEIERSNWVIKIGHLEAIQFGKLSVAIK